MKFLYAFAGLLATASALATPLKTPSELGARDNALTVHDMGFFHGLEKRALKMVGSLLESRAHNGTKHDHHHGHHNSTGGHHNSTGKGDCGKHGDHKHHHKNSTEASLTMRDEEKHHKHNGTDKGSPTACEGDGFKPNGTTHEHHRGSGFPTSFPSGFARVSGMPGHHRRPHHSGQPGESGFPSAVSYPTPAPTSSTSA